MSENQRTTPAAGAVNKYPPFPDNPFNEETRGDIEASNVEATCTDYVVVENHKRHRYGTNEVEVADFISFLFEITAGSCKGKKIASTMMKISMYRKSNLYAFLSGWLGREPESDFQPQSFIGATATLTVGMFPGTKNPEIRFSRITTIAPGKDTDDNTEGKTA